MTIAIQARQLTRHFGDIRAVHEVSLDIARGSVFGFLGPNGAGKTTTIRLLLGLIKPTSGGATVLGHDIIEEPDAIREETGVVLEHSGLYECLTAEENLEVHGRLRGLRPGHRDRRIDQLLSRFGLDRRRDDVVAEFSRGMRQRLALARALLHRPALLFLDEPTAGLDPEAAAALREDITSMTTSEGTTVFLTTHNLFEAEQICDQVGLIRQGTLLASGPPDFLGPPDATAGGSALETAYLQIMSRNRIAKETP